LLALVAIASFALAETTVDGSYIVVFKQDSPAANVARHMATLKGNNVTVVHEYNIGGTFRGYNLHCDKDVIANIKQDPAVKYVEAEHTVDLPIPNTLEYAVSSVGVDVYILDTGVYTAHSDYNGRARFGASFIPNEPDGDENGHGTHCGSTAAGTQYGICKSCGVISVKVLGRGGSAVGSVIGGINWTVNNARQTGRRGVINMSLRSRFGWEQAMDDAVDAAVTAGVVCVSASGNSNDNTCNHSPSAAPFSFTVGATTRTDAKAGYSSWGTCQDVWAPGSDILGAWIGNPTATRTISGTSMAAPHAAGVAAVQLQLDPTATAFQIMERMVAMSTPGKVQNGGINGTPNRMLHYKCSDA